MNCCYYYMSSIPVLCHLSIVLISTIIRIILNKSRLFPVGGFSLNTKAIEQNISSSDTLCPEFKDIKFLDAGRRVQRGRGQIHERAASVATGRGGNAERW